MASSNNPNNPPIYGQDTWVVKVDSMGCLEPGCHLITGLTSQVTNLRGALRVWPNPVGAQGQGQGQVQVAWDLPEAMTGSAQLTLVSAAGQVMGSGSLVTSLTASRVTTRVEPPLRKISGLPPAVAAAAIFLAGFDVYRQGLTALRRGRLNINALMTVAVTGAFLIGQWPEAAMVMALYAIAEAIEARAAERARNAIKSLLDLAPEEASVLTTQGDWVATPVAQVAIGARARVRPGERIPLDGIVRAGRSSVNQAPVTGESLPVDKAAGDPVFAGTINTNGSVEFEVTEGKIGQIVVIRLIHEFPSPTSR